MLAASVAVNIPPAAPIPMKLGARLMLAEMPELATPSVEVTPAMAKRPGDANVVGNVVDATDTSPGPTLRGVRFALSMTLVTDCGPGGVGFATCITGVCVVDSVRPTLVSA